MKVLPNDPIESTGPKFVRPKYRDTSSCSSRHSAMAGKGFRVHIGAMLNEFQPDTRDDQQFVPRADPLVFDLDSDGIETRRIDLAAPILFDNNADGVLNPTGWIRADDGFLVLDRSGSQRRTSMVRAGALHACGLKRAAGGHLSANEEPARWAA